jgi:iron-sulfur cluster assembly accessory protein
METVQRTGPIGITEKAAAHVRRIAEREGRPDAYLRLRVTAGGCSGFSYKLSIEDDLADRDSVVEAHGLRMLIDPVTAPIVEGSTLDFNDTMLGGGLKVINPRAQHECACGESFSI